MSDKKRKPLTRARYSEIVNWIQGGDNKTTDDEKFERFQARICKALDESPYDPKSSGGES